MTDYKVNLPQTTFPMKANLPEREPKMLAFWEEINLHQKVAALNTEHSHLFILHDGPPYANGDIHIGHAYNKILKDIINKVNLMSGYAVPYVPGWDCHGLPIELNIEKKLGKAGDKVDATTFVAACREYATEQVNAQRTDFKRLGVLGDWEHPYRTTDYKYEADIIRALAKIVANGYLVRGHKPVHWCVACGSALAEAEVEYQDKKSPAIDVRFCVVAPEQLLAGATNISVPIWTTTPWTLPANEAVALHPELEYVLIKYSVDPKRIRVFPATNGLPDTEICFVSEPDEHLLLLKELAHSTLQRYYAFSADEYSIVKTFRGKELEGIMLQHPFLDKQVPIILGEHVTTDAGTGAVHTAPAHGVDDYKIGQRYHLPVNNPVGADGKFFTNIPHFANQNVFTANDAVITLLKERNNLLCRTTIQHSYPHCWRHKTPLIFRATPQWFIEMDGKQSAGSLRQRALAAIGQVNWLHPHGKERITSMVEQRPDWCISRQRFWGTPIALFIHKQSGNYHPETLKLLEAVAKKVEEQSITFWQELDEARAQQFLAEHTDAQKYPPQDYVKVTDTLDVWFDSGVSHFCVLQQRPELHSPAHIYVEGSDQYRGWFQSSLLTAVAMYGHAPYHTVISHGFTVDGKGRKMSKSLGNVVSPQKIIKASGADILRLWVTTAYPYDEIAASDEIIKGSIDIYRKLRNTARYLLANLYDFKPARDARKIDDLLPLDRWALSEVMKMQEDVMAHNNQEICVQSTASEKNKETLLKFYSSCMKIQNTASSLSNFYFSVIKDRLYTMQENSHGRRSAQTALYYILEIFVRATAPFISFTAEEIWQEMRKMFTGCEQDNRPRVESVFLACFDDTTKKLGKSTAINAQPFNEWQTKFEPIYNAILKEIEKLRENGVIGSSLEAEVDLYCENELFTALQKFAPEINGESELRFILITARANIKPAAEKPHDAIAAEGITGLWIKARRSEQPKCARCWHHRADIGKNHEHPELCARCCKNLFSAEGEERYLG